MTIQERLRSYAADLSKPDLPMATLPLLLIPLLQEAADEIDDVEQASKEGWRYADELEQERKRLSALETEYQEAYAEAQALAADDIWYCLCVAWFTPHEAYNYMDSEPEDDDENP